MNSFFLKHCYLSYPNKNNITYKEFSKVVKSFFMKLSMDIVENGNVYRLPSGLGKIGVVKIKDSGKSFDWGHYGKTGEKVNYRNWHSDKYRAQIYWSYQYPSVTLPVISKIWKFKPARTLNRYLALRIKQYNSIHKYYDKHDY